MLRIKTPAEVQQQDAEQAAMREQQIKAAYQQPHISSALAQRVRSDWDIAKQHRVAINERLLNCLRRKKGEYSPSKLAALKEEGGSTIYMKIVAAKCRTAKAWLSDLFNPAGDRPFSLEPTPVADLPPDIRDRLISEALRGAQELGVGPEDVQELLIKHDARLKEEVKREAEERTERMAEHIEDLLVETGFRQTFSSFLDDLSVYPSAILKGLEFYKSRGLKWMEKNGRMQPVKGEKILPRVRRVSPFRAYPSPTSTDNLDGHWFIEHLTFMPKDLANMRGVEGYDEEALAHVINMYSTGGLREWVWNEAERADLEGRSKLFTGSSKEIDGLEWSGPIMGSELIAEGMGGDIEENETYEVSILVIGPYVVRTMVNFDPAGNSDIMHACWENVPGSFWGNALPEILADTEDAANAAARALMRNMAVSSGPQVGIDRARMAPGADTTSFYPFKVWDFDSSESEGSNSRDPIVFFQPQSNANELLMVYERYVRYGDEISGLPSYAAGSDSGAGAAKTARGLGMLMNAASKATKDVVRNIDMGVIEKMVVKYYNYLMLTHEDEGIKADAIARARGSDRLIHKEESAMRQQEFLGMTANPIDMQIIGMEGRHELLSEVARSSDIPVDRVIPSRDELKAKMAQQAQQAEQPPQQGAPSDQA